LKIKKEKIFTQNLVKLHILNTYKSIHITRKDKVVIKSKIKNSNLMIYVAHIQIESLY